MDSVGEGKLTHVLLVVRKNLYAFISFFTAAFDYQFGALANKENELMKAYFGLMYV